MRILMIENIRTQISLAPIHKRLGEGNGSNKRPTPNTAIAKKWKIKLDGRGFRPDSRAIAPDV